MDTILLLLKENNSLIVKFIQVILIIILALLVIRVVRVLLRRFEERLIRPDVNPQQSARYKTFLSTGIYVVSITVIFIAVLMILMVFGIDITPILASVGVASLAISLGAQTLIKDYIGGILILMEDQFRVGDTVRIGDEVGTVEQITLRYVSLRDVEGGLILIPNGDVRVVSRVAYDWMRVVVDFNVPFNADIGKVVGVLEGAMQEANKDPEIADDLLDEPEIQGWNSFSPWAVQVRMSVKSRPKRRLVVANVLRRYGLEALNRSELQVATPIPDSLTSNGE